MRGPSWCLVAVAVLGTPSSAFTLTRRYGMAPFARHLGALQARKISITADAENLASKGTRRVNGECDQRKARTKPGSMGATAPRKDTMELFLKVISGPCIPCP